MSPTPTLPREMAAVAQTAELRDAQIQAGAWTALLAALVSLIAVQAPGGPLPSMAATTLFGAVSLGIHRGWPWMAAFGCLLLAASAVAFAAGVVPIGAPARIPMSILAAAGSMCLAGAFSALREARD